MGIMKSSRTATGTMMEGVTESQKLNFVEEKEIIAVDNNKNERTGCTIYRKI